MKVEAVPKTKDLSRPAVKEASKLSVDETPMAAHGVKSWMKVELRGAYLGMGPN